MWNVKLNICDGLPLVYCQSSGFDRRESMREEKEYKGPAEFGLPYPERHSSVQANAKLCCSLWYGIWANLSY